MERKTYTHECPDKFTVCSTSGGLRFPFRVFVSLSVAPHRLHVLYDILPNLCLPCVTSIVLNLPDSFRGDTYDEVQLQALTKAFPHLWIHRFGTDLGPISKVLPTLRIADKKSDVIISVDDDTLYESETIIRLCQEHMRYPNAVISNIGGFNIWNMRFRNVLGFTGVLYPVHCLNDAVVHTMMEYITNWKQCRMHDDMTISMALANNGVEIRRLSESMYPCQVSAGLEDPMALFRITDGWWKHPACVWRIWGWLK
jgi:hypothetical protein